MKEHRIRNYIYNQKAAIIKDLIRLIKIPSVSNPGDADYPFGSECRNALDLYAEIASEHGLKSKNFDYSCTAVGISAAALSNPAEAVGIWSHVDVVPAGSGWTYPPFDGVYENGLVIGRGAQDNKCSAIAGLYILECINELKIPLLNNYLWYAGCSEECGMQDIDLYLEKYPSPKLNLIADCGFPVCIGEKTVAPRNKNSPVVKCLTDTYNRITGENAEPYCIGGSTYASKLPDAYPYGIILGHKDEIKKYMPAGHGDYHQPDEAVEIDKLLEAMVIYVISIIELDKEIAENE
ncbi:MAG: M20/M25/M40 family metallo-hydrolase [Candidatus Ornithomonoglobus sp.]